MAQELNNLRGRRRRARQRKASRKALQQPRNNLQNSSFRGQRTHRHSVARENALLRGVEPEEFKHAAAEEVAIKDVFSDDLVRYCESVVHPFGNEAIGALLPDKYQELVIPVTDRLELDITPDMYNILGNWQASASGIQLTGAFFWFQPRCLAAGQTGLLELTPDTYLRVPYICVDDEISAIDQSAILNQYNLCFTGIWDVPVTTGLNAPITYGLYSDGSNQTFDSEYIIPAYFAIQYTRFSNIISNCDKMRVLGAGLKCWSEDAPINTGGFSLGGWITIEDIMEALEIEARTGALLTPGAVSPGALKAIQPKIKFACRSPGVKGSTVRYSSLQTPEQVESEYPMIPERLYNVIDGGITQIPPGVYIDNAANQDLACNDIITPGSYVPCIYWSFNINQNNGNDNVNDVYTLKLMSMVHSEGTPTGESPFMTNKSAIDPAAVHAKQMLENLEIWPAATKGHSFKSFMKKTRHVIASVAAGVGTFTKLLGLADAFAATIM